MNFNFFIFEKYFSFYYLLFFFLLFLYLIIAVIFKYKESLFVFLKKYFFLIIIILFFSTLILIKISPFCDYHDSRSEDYKSAAKSIYDTRKVFMCGYLFNNECLYESYLDKAVGYPFFLSLAFFFFGQKQEVATNLNLVVSILVPLFLFLILYLNSKKVLIPFLISILYIFSFGYNFLSTETESMAFCVFFLVLSYFFIKLYEKKRNLTFFILAHLSSIFMMFVRQETIVFYILFNIFYYKDFLKLFKQKKLAFFILVLFFSLSLMHALTEKNIHQGSDGEFITFKVVSSKLSDLNERGFFNDFYVRFSIFLIFLSVFYAFKTKFNLLCFFHFIGHLISITLYYPPVYNFKYFYLLYPSMFILFSFSFLLIKKSFFNLLGYFLFFIKKNKFKRVLKDLFSSLFVLIIIYFFMFSSSIFRSNIYINGMNVSFNPFSYSTDAKLVDEILTKLPKNSTIISNSQGINSRIYFSNQEYNICVIYADCLDDVYDKFHKNEIENLYYVSARVYNYNDNQTLSRYNSSEHFKVNDVLVYKLE